jgi:hypothetical protein
MEVSMFRLIRVAAAMLSLTLLPYAASAAPITPAPSAAVAQDLVVQVHGCHRACVRAYVPRWGVVARHRHVGPNCMPQACGKRYNTRPPGWNNRGCFKLGPVWYCP